MRMDFLWRAKSNHVARRLRNRRVRYMVLCRAAVKFALPNARMICALSSIGATSLFVLFPRAAKLVPISLLRRRRHASSLPGSSTNYLRVTHTSERMS